MKTVLQLASELCDAFDAIEDDIGGHRSVGDILKELGPAVDREEAEEKARERYKHKKRGWTYTVLGEARLQTEKSVVDMTPLVLYKAQDGSLWARPVMEFHDGRFEKVTR